MFEIPDDKDISRDIILDRLTVDTIKTQSYMWERRNYNTYVQYLYEITINSSLKLIFRIYHYKTHDAHMLNIYMSKKRGMVYVSVDTIKGPKVLDLVKTIVLYDKAYDFKLD